MTTNQHVLGHVPLASENRSQAALRRLPEALTAGELARGFRVGDLTKQLGEEGVEGALGAELVGSAQARRRRRWFNQVDE